jgi:hypothetical protein
MAIIPTDKSYSAAASVHADNKNLYKLFVMFIVRPVCECPPLATPRAKRFFPPPSVPPELP